VQVAGIGPDRLARDFTLKPNGSHIAPAIRESIVFAPHNLIRDSPSTKLDLMTSSTFSRTRRKPC
jgi:chemotaxis methyl-accepting protein methylase